MRFKLFETALASKVDRLLQRLSLKPRPTSELTSTEDEYPTTHANLNSSSAENRSESLSFRMMELPGEVRCQIWQYAMVDLPSPTFILPPERLGFAQTFYYTNITYSGQTRLDIFHHEVLGMGSREPYMYIANRCSNRTTQRDWSQRRPGAALLHVCREARGEVLRQRSDLAIVGAAGKSVIRLNFREEQVVRCLMKRGQVKQAVFVDAESWSGWARPVMSAMGPPWVSIRPEELSGKALEVMDVVEMWDIKEPSIVRNITRRRLKYFYMIVRVEGPPQELRLFWEVTRYEEHKPISGPVINETGISGKHRLNMDLGAILLFRRQFSL